MSTSWVFAFALISLVACGCTKTVQQRVASYYPGAAPTTQPVPTTGVYSIRLLDEKGKKTGGIPNSHRVLQAGDHAGFDIDGDKGIVAVAGDASFPITIPDGYGAVWSATYHKPTQFAKEVGKATKVTAKVAGYVAAGFVEAMLDSSDDDCDETFEGLNRHLKEQRRLRNRH